MDLRHERVKLKLDKSTLSHKPFTTFLNKIYVDKFEKKVTSF